MPWAPCMLPFSLLALRMLMQCSQRSLLSEQSFIEKEQLECIQLCLMLLLRQAFLIPKTCLLFDCCNILLKKSKGQEADFTTQRCYLKDITKQLILCLFSSFRRLLERFKIIPFICFIMCKLFTCVLWFFFLLSNLHLLLQVTIELPYILVQAVVYGIIIYAMIGFEWTVAKVFWYLFFMYFTFLYFTFYGMMAVAVTPNQHISSIVSTAFYSIWNLFSGFIVPRPVSFGFLSFIVYLNSLNNILVPVIWIFFLFSSL